MKRVAVAVFLVVLLASSALAYMSFGEIQAGWAFKNLSVSGDFVQVTIENKSGKSAKFFSRLYFLDINNNVIAKTWFRDQFQAGGSITFSEFLEYGDERAAKKAFKIAWGDTSIHYSMY